MSQQSEAKKAQEWSKDPLCCDTCRFCEKTKVPRNAFKGDTYINIYRKCEKGGFAVKPMNSCLLHERP